MMPIIRPLPKQPSAPTEYEKELAHFEQLKADLQSRKLPWPMAPFRRAAGFIPSGSRPPTREQPRSPVP